MLVPTKTSAENAAKWKVPTYPGEEGNKVDKTVHDITKNTLIKLIS